MNGRVYDAMLGRFTSADPITESPYSTQGWNRYAYVGNSPLNFTDPSGYCFMGCFWNSAFKGIGAVFRRMPILGSILQIAAGAVCSAIGGPGAGAACASAASAFVAGVTSGNLGAAIRAGLISAATAFAFNAVGEFTQHQPTFLSAAHVANVAGHAAVGCASAVASGGKCGPGALSGAVGSFAAPLIRSAGLGLFGGTAASAVVGGLASVAGGGKFENGAVTGAFGYLFNFQQNGHKLGNYVTEMPTEYGSGGGGSIWSWFGAGAAVGTATVLGGDISTDNDSTGGDVQYVVRGGLAAPSSLEQGTTLSQNRYGFSVQTAPGVPVDELARGGRFPNAQISVSTVDALEAIPGVHVNAPTPGAGTYHGTVNVPNPPPPGIFEAISGAFTRMPNPYRTPR